MSSVTRIASELKPTLRIAIVLFTWHIIIVHYSHNLRNGRKWKEVVLWGRLKYRMIQMRALI